jgi:hypothetical protein
MFKFITDFFDSLWMKQYIVYVNETHNQVNNGLVETRQEVEIYDDKTGRRKKDLSVIIDCDERDPVLFGVSLGANGKKHAKERALAEVRNYKHLHNIRAINHVSEVYGVPITETRPRSVTYADPAFTEMVHEPRVIGDMLQVGGNNPALFISPDGINWHQIQSLEGNHPVSVRQLPEKVELKIIEHSRKLVVFKND